MRRRVVIAALACAAACLLAPPAALAARPLEVAIQDDHVFLSKSKRSRAFDRAKAIGATRIRVNLVWAYLPGAKPNQATITGLPQYKFSRFDSFVTAATARGFKIHLTLTGPMPAWATGNHRQGTVNPSPTRFGEFAAAAAEHYKGKVDRYSLINEPNFIAWLRARTSCKNRMTNSCGRGAARIYGKVFRAGYDAIKGQDPDAEVLFGETSPYANPRAYPPLRFLRDVLASSGPLEADGYAHHPYDFLVAPSKRHPGKDNVTIANIGGLATALSQAAGNGEVRTPGGGPLPIFLTEYGYWGSGRYAIPKSRAAKWLVQAFGRALRAARVRSMLVYQLRATRTSTWDTALLNRNGTARPAYKSLKRWATRMRAQGRIR